MFYDGEWYFLVDSKNQILSHVKVASDWISNNLTRDNALSEIDLQHYALLKSFLIVVVPGSFDFSSQSPATSLTIPYTFKLTCVSKPPGSGLKIWSYSRCETSLCLETPYLNTVRDILSNGEPRDDRTGTGTISIFGNTMRFDISNYVPLLTTKFVPWRACIHELLWFLTGSTNSTELENVKVNIWKDNTSREFLDSRGLQSLPEGDIGAGYGFQWRHAGASYVDCLTDYTNEGFDQIADVINQLRTNPTSRRIMFCAWNPSALGMMALPPCHVLCQFYVSMKDGNKFLSCQMYQRSQDVFLGAPFNIFSYAVLTHILAKMCDMKPKELIIVSGDTHIYKDHVEQMREQLKRIPLSPAQLVVSDEVAQKSIDDLSIDDFQLEGYFYHPRIYGKMSA